MELKDISEIRSYKKINSLKKNELIDKEIKRKINNKMLENSDLELYTMKYSSDGLKIFGFIFKHKNAKINTPVVIHCRGGNNHPKFLVGQLTIRTFYYHPLFELVKKNKIIIIASAYRGYKLSQGIDEFGGKDVNDIINLYPIIKKYKYTDENKIAIFGVSRGVMMSLLVHKKVDWVKCLILVAGVADMLAEIKKNIRPFYYKKLIKEFNLTKEDLQKRSAINWISELPNKAPILILHGSNDDRISVDNAYIFKEQFKKNKIPHKIVIYENGDHLLLNYINKESIVWIEKYLLK